MTIDNNTHFTGKYFEEKDQIIVQDNYFTLVLRGVLLQVDVKNACVLDVDCGSGLFLKPLKTPDVLSFMVLTDRRILQTERFAEVIKK